MVENNKVNIKLSGSQLNMLKYAVKNQTRVTLRTNIKIFIGNILPHESLLITVQKTKLRNAFLNNNSAYLKLSRTQRPKISHCGRFLRWLLSKITGP